MKLPIVFLASACAAASQAAFVFDTGTAPAAVDQNVLFVDATGPLVTGETNNTHDVIDFFGAGEDLVANGGQAKLRGVDGEITALTIAPSLSSFTITGIELNLFAADDGTATFVINGDPSITHTFDLDRSGQNRINVVATGGDTITSLAIVTTTGITDVKQVRVGTVQAVPEPASVAALGVGLLGFLKRRKKA